MTTTSTTPGLDLVARRVNKGLSQQDAAAAIGISRVTLDRAESDLSIQVAKAKLIADFYECEVTAIWPVERAA